MELEKFVFNELEKRGFHILHKNVTLRNNNVGITEYDIICKDFIIEVKSGQDIGLKRKQIKNQMKYLPNNSILYYFCPNKCDKEINEFNNYFQTEEFNSSLKFINSLEEIYKIHKIYNEYNIKSQKEFTRFLSQPFNLLKTYNKIFVTMNVFYNTYLCINFVNDFYGNRDDEKNNIKLSSQKIEYLINNNIINMVDNYDNNLNEITTKTLPNSYDISNLDKVDSTSILDYLEIRKKHYVKWSKSYMKSIDINKCLPIIEGITKLCSCKKRVTFVKLDYCHPCNEERKKLNS